MSEASDYEVELHELAPTPAAVIRKTVAWSEITSTVSQIFSAVSAYLKRVGAEPDAAFGRYNPQGERIAMEVGFTIDRPVQGEGEIVATSLPGGEAAVCLHVGPYDTVSEAYAALTAWIKEQGREQAGAPWEVYTTPPEEQPPVTEVVFPLKGVS
jgi:effector-binding domain-containing protein